jgi:hypothetical protein
MKPKNLSDIRAGRLSRFARRIGYTVQKTLPVRESRRFCKMRSARRTVCEILLRDLARCAAQRVGRRTAAAMPAAGFLLRSIGLAAALGVFSVK